MSTPIDGFDLLRKYMAHVIENEGWDFLQNLTSVQFTPEEMQMLERLAHEARQ